MDILIVEDNALVREAMADQMGQLKGVSNVRTANDGRAALMSMALAMPHLLILDLRLPEMSGFAVLDALRAAAVTVPVLAMSSNADYRAASLAKGARSFFDKSSETELLFATVARIALDVGRPSC
jgi:DNA-binding NarL/FixJ family response regulator